MTTGPRNSGIARRRPGPPSPDVALRRLGPAAARAAGGFTLLELILVMVLISAVLAMAAPSLRGFFASRQTGDAAMRITALTQWARSQAVARGQCVRLNIDPQGSLCWMTVGHLGAFVPAEGEAGRGFELPEGARASLRSASRAGSADPNPPGRSSLFNRDSWPSAFQPAASGRDPAESYVQFYPSGRNDLATIEVKGREGEVYLVACASPAEPFRVISPAEAAKP